MEPHWKEKFDDKFLLTEEDRSMTWSKNVDFDYVLEEMPKVKKFIENLLESDRKEYRECLEEAVVLMENVVSGDYKPDSFTTQPWRALLKTN